MSEASQSPITATAPLPPTSRRRLLAGSGFAAIAAGLALPVAVPPVHAAAPDPVVALYAKWHAVEDAIVAADAPHTELRNDFVARYGEPLSQVGGVAKWDSDPRRGELDRLTNAVNDLCDESTDLVDAMMKTPATSLAGIHCKMIVGLDVLKFIEMPAARPQYHDHLTVAFLRDAVRVLGGGVAA